MNGNQSYVIAFLADSKQIAGTVELEPRAWRGYNTGSCHCSIFGQKVDHAQEIFYIEVKE